MSIKKTFTGEILAPAVDKRLYRHITLSNELDCLLIHDPDTEMSSACCDVQVGSMCDPKEAQGLAHFLEHMLFMGTEKYPVENAYSSFLSSHGGSSNAYTSQENTVYFFDVQSEFLEGALDLFASFFTCPLFTESATEREMNAVDSENTKNLQSDMWRKFQLLKSLAKDDHPISSFSTGNLETLSKFPAALNLKIRDIVVNFYNQYYSANRMKLVVYGCASLDAMQQWAIDKFSAVPNKNLARPSFETDAYGPAQVQKIMEIVPIKETKLMEFFFPMPPVEHLYLQKPTGYISHLIGHESAGSILSALKAKGWANNLGSYLYSSLSCFACFCVSIELTDEGIAHTDEVAACVFAYIGMIKQFGPQEWVWSELKETADMNFRFQNKTEPSSYTVRLANNMQLYPPEHVLAGDKLQFECDLAASMEFLAFMTPANVIAAVVHKGLAGKTTLKEKWYGTEHNLISLTAPDQQERLQHWERALTYAGTEWERLLHLPLRNEFLPTDFSLRADLSEVDAQTTAQDLKEAAVAMGDAAGDAKLRFPALSEKIVSSAPVAPTQTAEEAEKEGNEIEVEKEAVQQEASAAVDAGVEVHEALDKEEEEEDEEEVGGGDGVCGVPIADLCPGTKMASWYQLDTHWRVPKLNVNIMLESQFATNSPLNVALTDLFAQCLKEVMNEYSYYADCAGLYYSVDLGKGGLEIVFQGYSHKLPVLVARTMEELCAMGKLASTTSDTTSTTAAAGGGGGGCTGQMFLRVKEMVLRNYQNHAFRQPYYHCILQSLLCLQEPRWSFAEKYEALKSATLADFHSFAAAFTHKLKAEVLVHGNASEEESKGLSELVVSKLLYTALPTSQEPVRRAVALSAGVEYVYRQHAAFHNPNEVNSAIESIYVVGDSAVAGCSLAPADAGADLEAGLFGNTLAKEAMLELLGHMISEPAFDQLRTKEQLGYIVFASLKRADQLMGLHIIVQSSHKDPAFLDSRVEDFLVSYRADLAQFSEETMATFVQAVVEKLLEKPKNINQETARNWEEIKSGAYLFKRRQLLVSALKQLPLKTVSNALLPFFDRYIAAGGPERRKLCSQFYGSNTKYPYSVSKQGVVQQQLIEEPSVFKRSMPLLPLPTPYLA